MRFWALQVVCFLIARIVFASPAPAPLLQTPAAGALNVDPDGVLSWRWVDDLISNGSFESGMSPGWYTGGTDPGLWSIYTDTTNSDGMGYRFATVEFPYQSTNHFMGQLIQDLYVPADAISATLQWKERIVNNLPPRLIARLRVLLAQGGIAVALLEDANGNEPQFRQRTFVSRSTNLLAYAGQTLQLIFQADNYFPVPQFGWYADIDGVSLACEHLSTPEFQVLVGNTSTLRATNQIGSTTDLTISMPLLVTNHIYYWKVGAVRDGVTNFSSTFQFKTGPRMISLTYKGFSANGILLGFSSKTNRSYTIEQKDGSLSTTGWYDLLPIGPGTGDLMEAEVPLPFMDEVYWRLRVSQ